MTRFEKPIKRQNNDAKVNITIPANSNNIYNMLIATRPHFTKLPQIFFDIHKQSPILVNFNIIKILRYRIENLSKIKNEIKSIYDMEIESKLLRERYIISKLNKVTQGNYLTIVDEISEWIRNDNINVFVDALLNKCEQDKKFIDIYANIYKIIVGKFSTNSTEYKQLSSYLETKIIQLYKNYNENIIIGLSQQDDNMYYKYKTSSENLVLFVAYLSLSEEINSSQNNHFIRNSFINKFIILIIQCDNMYNLFSLIETLMNNIKQNKSHFCILTKTDINEYINQINKLLINEKQKERPSHRLVFKMEDIINLFNEINNIIN